MNISCPICYEEYKLSGERLPRIIPTCGHSLCGLCLSRINDNIIPRCPIDKKGFKKSDNIEDFPVNYGLISVIETRDQTQHCPEHSEKLWYFCITDRRKICSECLFDEHRGHELQKFVNIQKEADDCRKELGNLSQKATKAYKETLKEIEEKRRIHLTKIDSACNNLIQAILSKKLCLEFETNLFYDMNKNKVEELLGKSSTLLQSISSKESCLQEILKQEDLLKPLEEFPNVLSELTIKYEEVINSSINKQNLSEACIRAQNSIEISFQNLKHVLCKIKINPENLSDLQRAKSRLDFEYEDNCLYVSNNTEADQEIKIDLERWKEAEKLNFTFHKEISKNDSSFLAYIWDNLKNPLVLQLKFVNKTLTKELYDIFCSSRHNFKEIRIDVKNYDIDSESLVVTFVRRIFQNAENIITADITLEYAELADGCAERMFKDGIFDTTNLRHLSINLSDTNVNDQDIKDLFVAIPQLNTFRFNADCSEITDETLISCAKKTLASAQSLQTIDVSLYSTEITDVGIENLCRHLNSTEITSLRLFLLETQITDTSVELLSHTMVRLNMFNTLCKFDLEICYNRGITDNCLDKIFLPMPNVREYSLTLNKVNVSDKSIQQLAENCLPSMNNLKKFNIELNFTSITDACLNQLLKSLKGIKEINLFLAGTMITDETLEPFVQEKIADGICEKLDIKVSHTKINAALKEKLGKIATEGFKKYR